MRKIEIKSITAGALHEQLAQLSQYGTVFLSGTVRANIEPNGTTVQTVGNGRRLYYADVSVLADGGVLLKR